MGGCVMATTVTTWTAAHTGLPSFRVVNTAAVTVACGSRTVARLSAGDHLFSDPLADPGSLTYRIDGVAYMVERDVPAGAAIFTDITGRGVSGLVYQADEDEIDYRPDVARFNRAYARWGPQTPPRTGKGTLVLTDPAREPDVWGLCQRQGRVILAPAVVSPDDPLRVVVITAVRRQRTQVAGWIAFEVTWSEIDPLPSPAPVVTWGEWAALGAGWQARSAVQLARDVAGMP